MSLLTFLRVAGRGRFTFYFTLKAGLETPHLLYRLRWGPRACVDAALGLVLAADVGPKKVPLVAGNDRNSDTLMPCSKSSFKKSK